MLVRRLTVLAAFAPLLASCTCGENRSHAVRTTLEDQGVKVGITVTAKVSSGYTRNGLMTTHRYDIGVTYPGRDSITITVYTRTVLSKEQMQAKLGGLALKVSPDGKHFALQLAPFSEQIRLVHLMLKGCPFSLEALDKKLALKKLADAD